MLLDAFDSGWIAPAGPDIDAFEVEFAESLGNGTHAAALSSGTAALHLALQLVGVQPGDEVLVSDLTFAATANAVRYCSGVPTFIDSEPSTWNMDPGLLNETLEHRSRTNRLPAAVITVDLYGQCADYDRITEICEEYGVPLIEDAAEALGATWRGRPAGTFGAIAAFSFNGNKIITSSGGGMLCTSNAAHAARARFLASQAREPFPHYEHEVVGYNYRLSNLLAALGRAQLRSLPQRVAARRAVRERYLHALGDLPGVAFMPNHPAGEPTNWLTVLTIDPDGAGATTGDVQRLLHEHEIESRPAWKPMHLQPVYRDCEVIGGSFSKRVFETGLCLPSGSNLTEAEQQRVIELVRSSIERGRHGGRIGERAHT